MVSQNDVRNMTTLSALKNVARARGLTGINNYKRENMNNLRRRILNDMKFNEYRRIIRHLNRTYYPHEMNEKITRLRAIARNLGMNNTYSRRENEVLMSNLYREINKQEREAKILSFLIGVNNLPTNIKYELVKKAKKHVNEEWLKPRGTRQKTTMDYKRFILSNFLKQINDMTENNYTINNRTNIKTQIRQFLNSIPNENYNFFGITKVNRKMPIPGMSRNNYLGDPRAIYVNIIKNAMEHGLINKHFKTTQKGKNWLIKNNGPNFINNNNRVYLYK